MSIALFGLIGVLLGWLLNYFSDYKKEKREEKNYIKRKREEVYIEMLNIIYQIRKETTTGKLNPNLYDSIEKFYPKVNIYASKNIKNKYNKVAKSKTNEENLLIEAIREELGIVD